MTCPCGVSHGNMLYFTAKYLLSRPDETRQIWRNWSNPKHKNAKSPEFLAKVKAEIEAIRMTHIKGA